MEMQIEIKPFVANHGQKYKIIHITDIALHTSDKLLTPSHGKKLEKAFEHMEPGRIVSPLEQSSISADGSIDLKLLAMDEDFVRMIRNEEAKGYKVLIQIPKTGIPVVPGADTIEFMKSKNGKRILRKLSNQKRQIIKI
jgi:hypothetical protein